MELYAKCYLNNLSKRWSQTDIKTIAFYTHLSHLFPLAQWENNSFNKLKAPLGTHCLAPMNCPVKTFTYLSLNSTITGTEITDLQLLCEGSSHQLMQVTFWDYRVVSFESKILTNHYFQFSDIFYLMILINCYFGNICGNK